ncbi:MAG: NAD(P)H-hydrate dehydratase [Bacteroidetes bacterium]|nr:NAD(P)H-hydrate dehydratase [Bacteroidota bacterium]
MQPALPLFSAEQIKAIDAFTIQSEPITSVDLMERAAFKCTHWLMKHFDTQAVFKICCGLGNNGGDGLAIARQLLEHGYKVEVFIINYSDKCSNDFLINKQQLKALYTRFLMEVNDVKHLPHFQSSDIIIDALFGIGLSKPLSGLAAECVNRMNESGAMIIAIDIPSGLFADKGSDKQSSIVKAQHTLTFQSPKLGFMFAENSMYIGKGHVLDIDLKWTDAIQKECSAFYLTEYFIKQLLKPRPKFSHKGTFGHSLLIAGSYGKMGAAIMSAHALLRSGAGLLTVCVPQCGYEIIQTAVPEAMALVNCDEHMQFSELNTSSYSVIGIGPGLGTEADTQQSVKVILETFAKPLVIDADALNAIGLYKEWLAFIPKDSILTPHPKEFERLTKPVNNDFERHRLQLEFSKQYNVYVVLKGAHTCITTPQGDSYFNSTGNSGLAKGGSGDVLTGLITGLVAQGYSSLEASVIGVYVHGLAGDMTRDEKGEIAMIPTDVIENIPNAFMRLME